jgi:hypothetical protein
MISAPEPIILSEVTRFFEARMAQVRFLAQGENKEDPRTNRKSQAEISP